MDFTLVYDRWMMLLTPDSVAMIDVNDLTVPNSPATQETRDGQETSVEPSTSETMWSNEVLDAEVCVTF